MSTYQYDLFDDEYNRMINRELNHEIPALLLRPVIQPWDKYDEGSWEDLYDHL